MNIRKKKKAAVSLCMLFLLALGCEETTESSSSGICIAGESLSCSCLDGSTGFMFCTEYGSFSDCQCNDLSNNNSVLESDVVVTNSSGTAGFGTEQQPVLIAQAGAIGPIDPAGPIDPPSPTDLTGPANPTDPVDPGGPTNPAAPVEPTDPVDPGGPTNPAAPVEPTDPVDPGVVTDPPDDNANCIIPDSVGDFTAVDVNPDSPTYNQERSLYDVCNKVVIIFSTMFH